MTGNKILTIEQAADRLDQLQRQGRSVVLAFGCFDLLHPGHTRYLAAARSLGDSLLVAVYNDDSARARQGPGRPISPAAERAEILAELAVVDYVIIYDDPSLAALIARLRPRVVALSAGADVRDHLDPEQVRAAGGRIVQLPETSGFSTSTLIQTAVRNLG